MRAVNLLPKDAERAARVAPNPALLVAVGGFAVVFAVLFSMYFSARQNLTDKQANVRQLQAQLKLQKPAAKPLAIQQQLASVEPQRKQALTSALGYRIPWDVALGQVARALPADVSLTDLQAEAPVSPAVTPGAATTSGTLAAGPGVLTLDGYAPSQEEVARVMSRLSVIPALRDVVLVSSVGSNPQPNAPTIYNFTIRAHLQQPGVPS